MYHLGEKFTIHTDQRSLHQLMTQVIKTPAQNRVVDALFRNNCLALSIPNMEFLEKFKEHVAQDVEFRKLVQDLKIKPEEYKDFQLVNELVFFKGKLFVSCNSPWK